MRGSRPGACAPATAPAADFSSVLPTKRDEHQDGGEFWRPLTFAEQRADLPRLKADMDAATEEFSHVLAEERLRWWRK